MIEVEKTKENRTSTGKVAGYTTKIYHKGLKEYKIITGKDKSIFKAKVHNAKLAFDKKWEKEIERKRKENLQRVQSGKIKKVEEMSREAKLILDSMNCILKNSLRKYTTVNWDKEKDYSSFDLKASPKKFIEYGNDGCPIKCVKMSLPLEPQKNNFYTKISLLNKLLGKKDEIEKEQESKYSQALGEWKKEKESLCLINIFRENSFQEEEKSWNDEEKIFQANQKEYNQHIDELKESYFEKHGNAIVEYCRIILRDSKYPIDFNKNFDLQFNSNNKMLLIDYKLPKQEQIPRISHVKYIKSRDEIQESSVSQAQHNKIFDSVVYQICLRTLFEIFSGDKIDAISAINLNGIVDGINSATGHKEAKAGVIQ